jgi:hypothetical protein
VRLRRLGCERGCVGGRSEVCREEWLVGVALGGFVAFSHRRGDDPASRQKPKSEFCPILGSQSLHFAWYLQHKGHTLIVDHIAGDSQRPCIRVWG